jgi:hypothetical protein
MLNAGVIKSSGITDSPYNVTPSYSMNYFLKNVFDSKYWRINCCSHKIIEVHHWYRSDVKGVFFVLSRYNFNYFSLDKSFLLPPKINVSTSTVLIPE